MTRKGCAKYDPDVVVDIQEVMKRGRNALAKTPDLVDQEIAAGRLSDPAIILYLGDDRST